MTAATPGQAAYAKWVGATGPHAGKAWKLWDALRDDQRELWEEIAQAGIAAQQPKPALELDEVDPGKLTAHDAVDREAPAYRMGLAFERARAMGEPLSACWEAAYQTAWKHWIGQSSPSVLREAYGTLSEAYESGPAPELGESVECDACGLHRPPTQAERDASELAAYEADIASLTDQRNRVSDTADRLRAQVRNLRDALERCRDAAGRSPAAVHAIASQALASSADADL